MAKKPSSTRANRTAKRQPKPPAARRFPAVLRRKQTNITERKQAEEVLRESEERFHTLYDETPSMYFTVDQEGTVCSVNKFGAEQLGYRKEELIGRSVLTIFYDEDKNAVGRSLAEAFANASGISEWTFRKIKKDGTVIWVKETVRIMSAGAGAAPVALITCEDITEQKRQHETLVQLQRAVDHAMDGLALLNADGLYTYMNPAHAALFGFEVEELIGQPWRALYGPEQQAAIEQHHLPFLLRDGYWHGELVGRKKTGEPFDVEVVWQEFGRREGHKSDVICTCRDITKIK
ncbi:MAG: PAS domain S-box protein, partial [Nitrospirae bacterium]|nr:PAS domain S-box protein [Nitrospirota bacterium]